MEIRKSRSALFSFGGGKGASFPSRFIYLDLASMAQVRRARSLAPGLRARAWPCIFAAEARA